MKIYRKCTTEPYSFLGNDRAFLSDDARWFKKIFQKECIINHDN